MLVDDDFLRARGCIARALDAYAVLVDRDLGACEPLRLGLIRTPLSSTVMSTLRLAGTCVVLVARSQLKGGRLESMPVTTSSRSERRKKRFHVIDTSHSA